MSPQFTYAKPSQFYYHKFDPKSLQYTNIPISGSVPEPPEFAKREEDVADEEKPADEPGKNAQDDQPSSPEEKQATDPGELTFSLDVTHVANITPASITETEVEEKVQESASEPIEPTNDDTASGDLPVDVEEANKECPQAEGDAETGPAEVENTHGDNEPVPEASGAEAISEDPDSSEEKIPEEVEAPPIDPVESKDIPAAEGDTGDTVSSCIEYD